MRGLIYYPRLITHVGIMYKKTIVKALILKCSPSRFIERRHSQLLIFKDICNFT